MSTDGKFTEDNSTNDKANLALPNSETHHVSAIGGAERRLMRVEEKPLLITNPNTFNDYYQQMTKFLDDALEREKGKKIRIQNIFYMTDMMSSALQTSPEHILRNDKNKTILKFNVIKNTPQTFSSFLTNEDDYLERFWTQRTSDNNDNSVEVRHNDIVVFALGRQDINIMFDRKFGKNKNGANDYLIKNIPKYVNDIVNYWQTKKIGAKLVFQSILPPVSSEIFEFDNNKNNIYIPKGKNEDRLIWTQIFNKLLKDECEKHNQAFLDIHDLFADEIGMLNYKYLSDVGFTSHTSRIPAANMFYELLSSRGFIKENRGLDDEEDEIMENENIKSRIQRIKGTITKDDNTK